MKEQINQKFATFEKGSLDSRKEKTVSISLPNFTDIVNEVQHAIFVLNRQGIKRDDIIIMFPLSYEILWHSYFRELTPFAHDQLRSDLRKLDFMGIPIQFISPENAAYVYYVQYSLFPEVTDFHFKFHLGYSILRS